MAKEAERRARSIAHLIKGTISLEYDMDLPAFVALPSDEDYDRKVEALLRERMPPAQRLALETAYEARKPIVVAIRPRPKRKRKRKGR